jgi:hypothetical protein
MDAVTGRYRIRYAKGLLPLFTVLGLGRGLSKVELDAGELRVGMGWALRARIPRASIAGASGSRPIWWAIGVHGDFHGDWLVNGSPKGIVWLAMDPPARARVMGIPVTLRRLGLGLEDPDGFLAALSVPAMPAPA